MIFQDDEAKSRGKVVHGHQLLSVFGPPADLTVSPIGEQRVYLQVDTNTVVYDDEDSEYRYLSDAMAVPPFYPSELSKQMFILIFFVWTKKKLELHFEMM